MSDLTHDSAGWSATATSEDVLAEAIYMMTDMSRDQADQAARFLAQHLKLRGWKIERAETIQ